MRVLAERLHQIGAAGKVEHPEARPRDPGEVEGHEAECQRLGLVGAERLVDDWAVVRLADDQALGLRAAFDRNLLLDQLEGP